MKDMKTQFFSAGLLGFHTGLEPFNAPLGGPAPARGGPSDHIDDVGADLTYQYLGNRDHTLHLRAAYIHERRRYGSTPVTFGQTALPSGTVKETSLSATYFYKSTYGVVIGRTLGRNSSDPGRFLPYGRPDSNLLFIAPLWTVWGREDAEGPLGSNMQVGLYYLRFNRFNGSASDIFGPGTVRAKDLNTYILNARLAF